jgi:eukaryotic-like serine/threonine-protein kinase
MAEETTLIAPHGGTGRGDSSGWSGPLPDDVLQATARRLGLFCSIAAGTWIIGVGLANLLQPSDAITPFPWPGNLIAGVVVAVLLATQVVIKRRAVCSCALTIDLGLGLLIINAIGVALLNTWVPLPDPLDTRFVSWVTVVILAYAITAPSTPRKTFVAAVIAASMDPLALGLAYLRGLHVPTIAEIAGLYTANYICAVIAVVPAIVLQRLGRQIRKARELGSYELVERLGKGGMGEVWRAEHRLLARPAAIKLVRPEALGGDGAADLLMRRFEREAQATAVLSSPHTINLFDFGVTNDGSFYYVMELLIGRDLESFVKEFGPVPADRAVFLLRQICHSLAEAHVRGLVHRDIKPANIYNCRMGLDYDFVKVLDFGLVTFARPGGPSPLMTADRMTTGTPAYMAPEVILGSADIDNRADVYSLGCVAYWLLTGRLVFEAESTMQVLMHHVQTPPTAPSTRTDLPIPRELEDLVMACLAKDPDQRPQRADELWQMAMTCNCESWNQAAARRWWETHLPQLTQPLVLAMPAVPGPAEPRREVSNTRIELTL